MMDKAVGILFVILGIIVLIVVGMIFQVIGIWLRAAVSSAKVSIWSLVGMKFRRVNPALMGCLVTTGFVGEAPGSSNLPSTLRVGADNSAFKNGTPVAIMSSAI